MFLHNAAYTDRVILHIFLAYSPRAATLFDCVVVKIQWQQIAQERGGANSDIIDCRDKIWCRWQHCRMPSSGDALRHIGLLLTQSLRCSHRPQTDSAPGVATWEVISSARKSSPVRPLACNWYYCAQFIAKPKAACAALRFSWAATSSNLWLMTSSIKPEIQNIPLSRQRRT